MNALSRAIKLFDTQTLFAERLGVSDMAISQWKKRGVPPKRAKDIERVTNGAVTRRELCPEFFDEIGDEKSQGSAEANVPSDGG